MVHAASFTVAGIHGALQLIALACFAIAAIAAWFAAGHKAVLALIAAGLFFAVLATMWTG